MKVATLPDGFIPILLVVPRLAFVLTKLFITPLQQKGHHCFPNFKYTTMNEHYQISNVYFDCELQCHVFALCA